MKLWSVQEIEANNVERIRLDISIDVFQDYVKMTDKLKNPKDLTIEEIEFLKFALSDNQQIRQLQDDNDWFHSVNGRLSEKNKGKQTYVSRDPLGETDKIRMYTTMQEALQSMANLISDGEVENIKTYEYEGRPYKMSIVVNTLMHDAAKNIFRLENRFTIRTPTNSENWNPTPKNPATSIHTLILRLQSISF
jgi:hypothetical protein